jgi:2-keto-3-deoxy-L-rhamnonate aldolase RhmA
MLRAARGAGIIPVVRTLEADILRILDIGASAIQVPQMNSAEQARRIVAAAKCPRVGKRGTAFSSMAWRGRSLLAWHRACCHRASRISIDCAKWGCATYRW